MLRLRRKMKDLPAANEYIRSKAAEVTPLSSASCPCDGDASLMKCIVGGVTL